MKCIFIGGVNVGFGSGHSNFDFILILSCGDDTEVSADFVVTLCSPRDIMHVGELLGRM